MPKSFQTDDYINITKEIFLITSFLIQIWTAERIYITLPYRVILLCKLLSIISKNCLESKGRKITAHHHFTQGHINPTVCVTRVWDTVFQGNHRAVHKNCSFVIRMSRCLLSTCMQCMHALLSVCMRWGGDYEHEWLEKELHRIMVIHSDMSKKRYGTSKELSTG